MNILVLGVNYKRTPIEIREKLNFTIDNQKKGLAFLIQIPEVAGCAILSTCNRMEIYLHTISEDFNTDKIENALCTLRNIEGDIIRKYLYLYQGSDAVKHLFKVTSGLDSMVLGEDQILGQVKATFELTLQENCGSSILNELFKEAITVSKKIKTVTEISNNSVSVGSHAILSIEAVLGKDLSDKIALVIGAGKIGRIFLANLKDRGLKKIYVTMRGHSKSTARQPIDLETKLIDYHKRYDYIDSCDIVVSATTSPHYTITKTPLKSYITSKKPRTFVDLAVPRDIDKHIEEIAGVHYFNIDDLNKQVDENFDWRKREAVRAEAIIKEHVINYEKWYYFREMLPFVEDVKRFADDLAKSRASALGKTLKGLSQKDQDKIQYAIKKTADEIINKIVYGAKEIEDKEHMQVYFQCLTHVIKEG